VKATYTWQGVTQPVPFAAVFDNSQSTTPCTGLQVRACVRVCTWGRVSCACMRWRGNDGGRGEGGDTSHARSLACAWLVRCADQRCTKRQGWDIPLFGSLHTGIIPLKAHFDTYRCILALNTPVKGV
jgi:hypothetical protein